MRSGKSRVPAWLLFFRLQPSRRASPILLLHADERARRGVDRDCQPGGFARAAVDDVPGEFVGVVVPVADVNHRGGGILLQDLVAAVFLSLGEGLVGIHLEESRVKSLSGSVTGVVGVLISRGDAARRSVRRVAAGPEKRLHAVLDDGGEAGSPD